jgi:hypothetical protein
VGAFERPTLHIHPAIVMPRFRSFAFGLSAFSLLAATPSAAESTTTAIRPERIPLVAPDARYLAAGESLPFSVDVPELDQRQKKAGGEWRGVVSVDLHGTLADGKGGITVEVLDAEGGMVVGSGGSAMAGYGALITISGFEHHGPNGHLGFAPKLTPEDFRAPFTAAQGWGTYSQRIENGRLTAAIEVRYGQLQLATLALEHDGGDKVTLKLGDATLPATVKREGKRILITLNTPVEITPGEKLVVQVS